MKGLAFAIHVYRDQLPAQTRILRLRHFFPDSPIFCISDGVKDISFERFCQEQGVLYHQGDRLKPKGNAGRWSDRFLRFYLEQTAESIDTLIKIDPDTGIHRPFRTLPAPELDLFGSLYLTSRPNLCGGCMGIRRQAAERMVESELLPEIELGSYQRYDGHWLRPGEFSEPTEITFQDAIVFQVAQRLGLRMGRFPEVYANMGYRKPGAESRYALSHPYFYPGEPGYEPIASRRRRT